jgi:hypothetical protein
MVAEKLGTPLSTRCTPLVRYAEGRSTCCGQRCSSRMRDDGWDGRQGYAWSVTWQYGFPTYPYFFHLWAMRSNAVSHCPDVTLSREACRSRPSSCQQAYEASGIVTSVLGCTSAAYAYHRPILFSCRFFFIRRFFRRGAPAASGDPTTSSSAIFSSSAGWLCFFHAQNGQFIGSSPFFGVATCRGIPAYPAPSSTWHRAPAPPTARGTDCCRVHWCSQTPRKLSLIHLTRLRQPSCAPSFP